MSEPLFSCAAGDFATDSYREMETHIIREHPADGAPETPCVIEPTSLGGGVICARCGSDCACVVCAGGQEAPA